jgi:hypothetical protein
MLAARHRQSCGFLRKRKIRRRRIFAGNDFSSGQGGVPSEQLRLPVNYNFEGPLRSFPWDSRQGFVFEIWKKRAVLLDSRYERLYNKENRRMWRSIRP